MAVSLFAVNEGFLDDVDVAKVRAFEDALQGYMKTTHAKLLEMINKQPEYSDDVAQGLRQALEDFKAHHSW
jgi:F-type H+-transporting ATPase subunit alpha